MSNPSEAIETPVRTSTSERTAKAVLTTNDMENDAQGTSTESPIEKENEEDPIQYITGVRLYTVVAGLTVVAFLMMLDGTIVTTASSASTLLPTFTNKLFRRFPSLLVPLIL